MNQVDNRQIRVFISSTFEDMKDERDYLIKKVFPELKLMAAEREVTLIDVDLRWGITEEQAKNGQVVDICFNEIDNSIPFFIGIVGNRYGWCPEKDDVTNDNCLHYKTIKKYIDQHLSATEMEIQYGVLDREQPMYASFYIDSRIIDSDQIDYPDHLNALKGKIMSNKRYPWDYYTSKIDLGNKVRGFFVSLLDKLFPIEEKLSDVELLELNQRINLNKLCSLYIPDESRFGVLDSFVNDPKKRQLIIVGESGVGKSAFVAEWVKRNQSNRDIVYYSVGSGGNNSDKDSVLNHLAQLIKHKCNNANKLDNKNVSSILASLAEENRDLVIILDGFNQIELREDEDDLLWFPKPEGKIKYVITIATDRDSTHFNPRHLNSRHQLSSRDGAEEYVFKNLSKSIRKKIIESVLTKHGKNLDADMIEDIASCKVFQNCLSLRILLDELIAHPKHETIKKEIRKYLKSKNVDSFLFSVFDRYEQDYGCFLVRKVLLLLAISEKGFDEREIRNLVNEDLVHFSGNITLNSYTTPLEWSQFYCAFKNNFSVREGGLLGFSHQLVRGAVMDKYVSGKNQELISSLRKLIIETFQNENSPRAFLELRHQYQELGMHEKLHELICRPDVYYWMLTNCDNLLGDSWTELCVYSEKHYPVKDCINVWNCLDDSKKAKTYHNTEMMVLSIFVEKQGHLPLNPWPWEFAYMQELCIPYQKDVHKQFYYTFNSGSAYMSIPEKTEHALVLLKKSMEIIEDAVQQKWNTYYDDLQECYYKIAQWYHFNGDKKEEADYLERFVKPCEEHYGTYNQKTQFANYIAGYMRFENGEYIEAIRLLEKSLICAEGENDNEGIIKACNGLVQTYVVAFREEEQKNLHDFYNKNNYLKYIEYYEKMAIAKKNIGQTKEYKSMMRDIEEMRRSIDI